MYSKEQVNAKIAALQEQITANANANARNSSLLNSHKVDSEAHNNIWSGRALKSELESLRNLVDKIKEPNKSLKGTTIYNLRGKVGTPIQNIIFDIERETSDPVVYMAYPSDDNNLVSDLSFNEGDGIISGTPTATATNQIFKVLAVSNGKAVIIDINQNIEPSNATAMTDLSLVSRADSIINNDSLGETILVPTEGFNDSALNGLEFQLVQTGNYADLLDNLTDSFRDIRLKTQWSIVKPSGTSYSKFGIFLCNNVLKLDTPIFEDSLNFLNRYAYNSLATEDEVKTNLTYFLQRIIDLLRTEIFYHWEGTNGYPNFLNRIATTNIYQEAVVRDRMMDGNNSTFIVLNSKFFLPAVYSLFTANPTPNSGSSSNNGVGYLYEAPGRFELFNNFRSYGYSNSSILNKRALHPAQNNGNAFEIHDYALRECPYMMYPSNAFIYMTAGGYSKTLSMATVSQASRNSSTISNISKYVTPCFIYLVP